MSARIVLGASIFLLLSKRCASSCVPSLGCPGLGGSAGSVFLGTVLQVTDLPRTGAANFLSSPKARIQVNESFGGPGPEAQEIDVLTGLGGGDCGVPFKPGEVYLVEAFVSKDGLVHAGICSSTRRIDAVGAALRVLRQRRDGQTAPSLAGQIAQMGSQFRWPVRH